MTDGPRPGDVAGMRERRRRELAERLSAEEASGAPAGQLQQTRRQLRAAEQAAAAARAERQAHRAAEAARAAREAEVARAARDAGKAEAAQDAQEAREALLAAREAVRADRGADPADRGADAPAPRTRPRPVVRPPAAARQRDATGPGTAAARPRDALGDTPAGARQESALQQRPATATFVASAPDGSTVLPSEPTNRRPRWWWAAAVVALVLVAFAVLRFLDFSAEEGNEPGDADAPVQRTLALAVADGDGELFGAALLGTDGRTSSALLVPSRLLVDVAGSGRVPIADAATTGDGATGRALEDALDVRVDGTWVLTKAGLKQLVDGLGGIVVDVPAAVSAGGVTVPAGQDQQLDGSQAVVYASYLAADEPEPARSARIAQVLSGVLASLPSSEEAVADQLQDLGARSRSTVPDGELAAFVAELASTVRGGEPLGGSVLPVQEIATGGDHPLYGLDEAEARNVLESRFAGAVKPVSGDALRVLVQNGLGTPGLGEQARNMLVDAGMRFVGGGNAATLGRQKSVVAIPSDSEQDRERGLAVAEALGLPSSAVAVGRDSPTLADVVVVLGADFAAEASTTP